MSRQRTRSVARSKIMEIGRPRVVATVLLLVLSSAHALVPHGGHVRFANNVQSLTNAPRTSPIIGAFSTSPDVAYSLLEARVANSRVGPIARGIVDIVSKLPIFAAKGEHTQTLWARPLFDSLWQPVDIATILIIFFARTRIMRLLHAATTRILPDRSDVPYEGSVFPVLANALLMFGRLLTFLVLVDAGSYTLCKAGLLSQSVAGQIPEALDTVGYALLLGFTLTRIKKHVLRRAGGFQVGTRLKGSSALLDRLWGAAIWLFAGAGGAKVLSFELGFRLKSVLALGGLSSLVFGLACQTPLANVVKGLIIAASGSFATGEKISAAGLVGVVEEFGWYQSRIRTDGNELVTLPNSALADKQIVNLSRKTAKKLVAHMRLRYADMPKIRKVIDEMREVADGFPGTAAGRPKEVFLTEFGKSAVEIVAAVHVDADLDDKQLRQDFHLQLADVLERNAVQFQPVLELS